MPDTPHLQPSGPGDDDEGQEQLEEMLRALLGDGAKVSVLTLQDWDDDAVHLGRDAIRVGRDASVKHTSISFGGDVVRMHIENASGELHPMHLHGHHAVVLARDGVPATGSPWWTDSIDVQDGHSVDIAFVADNPGLWMDHCHNLAHPGEGLIAHLMYEGVTTPYRVGGDPHNDPE